MGTIYEDVDQDARDDHRHDPPAEWDEPEPRARVAQGVSADRGPVYCDGEEF
jgi:hypothetical protein